MVMFFDMVVELQCSTKFVVFWSIFAFLSVIAKEEQKKKKKKGCGFEYICVSGVLS